ncbi:hypothetical protein Bca101_009925 [Brassica carinata]
MSLSPSSGFDESLLVPFFLCFRSSIGEQYLRKCQNEFESLMGGSKLQSKAVREAISSMITHYKETKPRKFTETIKLQIGLKNYDPQEKEPEFHALWYSHLQSVSIMMPCTKMSDVKSLISVGLWTYTWNQTA